MPARPRPKDPIDRALVETGFRRTRLSRRHLAGPERSTPARRRCGCCAAATIAPRSSPGITRIYLKLREAKVPAELHLYDGVRTRIRTARHARRVPCRNGRSSSSTGSRCRSSSRNPSEKAFHRRGAGRWLDRAGVFSQQLPVTRAVAGLRASSVHIAQNGAGQLVYSIERKGETVIAPSALRVQARRRRLSQRRRACSVWPRSVDQVRKLVATKASEARDHFNELTLDVMPRSRAMRSHAVGIPRLRRRRRVSLRRAGRFRARDTRPSKPKTPSSRSARTTTARDSTSARVDSSHEGEFDPIQASRIREHNNYDLPLVCRTAHERVRHRRGGPARLRRAVSQRSRRRQARCADARLAAPR